MNYSEQSLSEEPSQQTEAIVAQHVHQLFQRLPMLSGFWLRPDREMTDLSVVTSPGYTAGGDLYEEVMQSLADLAEQLPEAVQLIRNVDTTRRETGCVLPQPVFATTEEVLYAHELRLQLRARLLRDAAAPTQRWCVGAD